MGGEIQDTSKKSVLKAIEQADLLQEVSWASDMTQEDDALKLVTCKLSLKSQSQVMDWLWDTFCCVNDHQTNFSLELCSLYTLHM